MGQFEHVVVVACGRSAVAKSGKKGALRNMHPVTLGGLTLKGVLEKLPQLKPDQIDDNQAMFLAKDIAKKIESELEYPGQIKVNVIREWRCVEYAK